MNRTSKAARQRAQRKFKYGLTQEQYDALLAEQNGLCAVCTTNPATHVDHDHKTNVVRGLLCNGCNLALGHLKDDLGLLHSAYVYIRRAHLRKIGIEYREPNIEVVIQTPGGLVRTSGDFAEFRKFIAKGAGVRDVN